MMTEKLIHRPNKCIQLKGDYIKKKKYIYYLILLKTFSFHELLEPRVPYGKFNIKQDKVRLTENYTCQREHLSNIIINVRSIISKIRIN